jgi:hypothetical protein
MTDYKASLGLVGRTLFHFERSDPWGTSYLFDYSLNRDLMPHIPPQRIREKFNVIKVERRSG